MLVMTSQTYFPTTFPSESKRLGALFRQHTYEKKNDHGKTTIWPASSEGCCLILKDGVFRHPLSSIQHPNWKIQVDEYISYEKMRMFHSHLRFQAGFQHTKQPPGWWMINQPLTSPPADSLGAPHLGPCRWFRVCQDITWNNPKIMGI